MAGSSPEPVSPSEEGFSAEDLNYREARTALELTLAELQSDDLEVEAMTALYRRALGYAQRCERLLSTLEQEVMQWDPAQPERPPEPYRP
jgi:exodeoxyribonuclease VII small subunit